MYLIGDIGNTEIKICLFNTNLELLRRLVLKTNNISNLILSIFRYLYLSGREYKLLIDTMSI